MKLIFKAQSRNFIIPNSLSSWVLKYCPLVLRDEVMMRSWSSIYSYVHTHDVMCSLVIHCLPDTVRWRANWTSLQIVVYLQNHIGNVCQWIVWYGGIKLWMGRSQGGGPTACRRWTPHKLWGWLERWWGRPRPEEDLNRQNFIWQQFDF